MQKRPSPRLPATWPLLLIGGFALVGCVPHVDIPPTPPAPVAGAPAPAPAGTGGAGGQASAGTGGAPVAGTGGPVAGSAGGAGGGAGGAGGVPSGGSGGVVRADAGGAPRVDAGRLDTGAPSTDAAPAAPAGPTFTRIFTEILAPGCTAPNNACHSVPRDQYFLFNAGMKDRSYMLLVNEIPRVGTIPGRVNTLLNYVTPQGNNPVRMPPQSGENLGNPPVRKPPLTAEQIQTIRTWASSGARND